MKTNRIPKVALILFTILIIGCEKHQLSINQEKILGTWISLDKTDTLDIIDESNFYKSTSHMHYDHYDYELFVDSIEIGYSGIMYVLVKPTKHYYSLEGDKLTIDFSNRNCYGFSNQESVYTKE